MTTIIGELLIKLGEASSIDDPIGYMRSMTKATGKKHGPTWQDVHAREAEDRLNQHHGEGWFKKLPKEQQKEYLSLHPNSKHKN